VDDAGSPAHPALPAIPAEESAPPVLSSARPDSPHTAWPAWTAPVALISGLVVAVVGSLLVDIPALALGVNVTADNLPDGLQLADTFVQDAGFVGVAIFFAQLGGRGVSAWQFGLRPTRLWRSVWLAARLGFAFLLFSIVWNALVEPPEEKVLEHIGVTVFSAALTCVVAPICEEFLFRGFIFTALRNWAGTWRAAVITAVLFGLVHAGSAPVLDLAPLAVLGFALCLLYRYTGSLYPCIAVHSVNNSLAFGSLAKWSWDWQIPLLMVGSLAFIALLALALRRLGVISAEPLLAA